MAYMNQERKQRIAAKLKTIVPKSWKYSLAVDNHSSIAMNIKSAPWDVIGYLRANAEYANDRDYAQINHYWLKEHLAGAPAEFVELMQKIVNALNNGNHDNSDIQSDYFDVGWYVDVNFGKWDKPFVNTAAV